MNMENDCISLSGEWDYVMKTEDGLLSGKIVVPFAVESSASGVAYTKKIYGITYKKDILLEKEKDKRIVIFFDAVDYETTVRINGINVGSHKGGYSPFSFDITDMVEEGRTTHIEVDVTDDTDSKNQARGKQCVDEKPHGCFYTRVTGIWQDVYIKLLPSTYLKEVSVDSFNTNGDAVFYLSFNTPIKTGVSISISKDGEVKAEDEFFSSSRKMTATLKVPSPLLWSPDSPNLYQYTIELEGQTVRGKLGYRTVDYDKEGFYINGEKTPLCMVLEQGYYEEGIYTPLNKDEFRADILRAKELGFNGARLHQKVFPESYLAIADELGFLIFGEYPSWGLDMKNPETIYNMIDEWMSVLKMFRSHASVIGYCPLNETEKGQCDILVQTIYRITKELDPSRPVIDTSGFRHVETDIYDIHDYEQDARVIEERYNTPKGVLKYDEYGDSYDGKAPLFLSEFGGTFYDPSFFPRGLFPGQDDAWKKWKSPENEKEIIDRITSLIKALGKCVFIGFCYTQLYDVEQEINGLFAYNRSKKFSDESYKRIREAVEEYKREVKKA